MSSARRRAASRANGKKSKGPVTPEGKTRSALNAVSHGLAAPGRLADSICLTIENRAEFIRLHEAYVAEHAPTSPTEHLLVEEMAVARWRLQRAWVMETALFENQMDRMIDGLERDYESIDNTTRLTLAYRELAEKSPALPSLQRYESRLSRQHQRCLKDLRALRTAAPAPNSEIAPDLLIQPNEPNPKNEHSQITPQPGESSQPGPGQPAPVVIRIVESSVISAQPAPEVGNFHRGSQRDNSPSGAGPANPLPRVA